MEDAKFVAPRDRQPAEFVASERNVAIAEPCDADPTDDHRGDHHHRDEPIRLRRKLDSHPTIAAEKIRDVGLTHAVHGEKLTRVGAHGRERAIAGGMHAVVVTRREVDDGELPAEVTRRLCIAIARVAKKIARAVIPSFDGEDAVFFDSAEAVEPTIGGRDECAGWGVNDAGAVFQPAGEERIKAAVRVAVRLGFVEVDTIRRCVDADDGTRKQWRELEVDERTDGTRDACTRQDSKQLSECVGGGCHGRWGRLPSRKARTKVIVARRFGPGTCAPSGGQGGVTVSLPNTMLIQQL